MAMLVYDVAKNPLDDLGFLYDLGFILSIGAHVSTFMLTITVMSKLCSSKTRGSMFALNGLAGSISVLIF